MTSERPYGFIKAMEFTLPWEAGKDKNGNLRADGGLHFRDGNLPTKYGIWKGANPDVDVENLTLEQAFGIYKIRYWDAYISLKPVSANLDNLPTALAVAVFDGGVNCGVSRAVRWLGKALEAKSPTKALNELRGAYYFDLVSQDRIKYGPNYKGWMNRLADMKKYCEVLEQEAQNNFDVVERMKKNTKAGWPSLS